MYTDYNNVPIHGVQGCTRSTGIIHIIYVEDKLSMHYDTESP